MANTQTTVPKFSALEVLSANYQNLTAGTGCPVFATTVTRDAAFGGTGEKVLAEGQICYLESTNVVQVYDGAAWQTVGPAPAASSGLTFITSQSFSATVTFSLTNVFSSAYKNYLVQATGLFCTTDGSALEWRVGTSGTPFSGANYNAARNLVSNGTLAGVQDLNTTSVQLIGSYLSNSANFPSTAMLNIYNPNTTSRTTFITQTVGYTSTAGYLRTMSNMGAISTATQYTDLFIQNLLSDNSTGTVTVYGLADS